jgi:hypothetical protein
MPPDRKCFRMIGGVLVERTVGEVLPALEETQTGVVPSVLLWLISVEGNCRTVDGAIQEERRGIQEMAEG